MPNLVRAFTPDNPLMQPVQYYGHEYFTSQFFHQQYLANSPHGGKHQRHTHFLHLLRSIEAYRIYCAQGDIVEILWKDLLASNDVGNQILVSFKPLFQAAGWNPLTLLNATAQAALSHHLDDEISKQMSVAINTTVARQASRKAALPLTRMQLVDLDVKAGLSIAASFGVPMHIAQQETVKLIEAEHGMNLRPLLLAAPAQDNIPVAAKMLEPMDLAAEFGWGRTTHSGFRMNKQLEAFGWQVRKIGGSGWDATPEGEAHCTAHAYTADHGGRSGYNYKWRMADVKQAFSVSRLNIQAPPHAQEER